MTYNYSNFPQYREFSSVSTLAFFLLTSRIISPVNHFGWLAALTVELETAAKMERLVMRCDGTFRTIILLPHWLAVKLRGRWGGSLIKLLFWPLAIITLALFLAHLWLVVQ